MTYRDLLRSVASLSTEQLDQEVAIGVIGADGIKVVPTCDFVDPADECFHTPDDEGVANREATYLDEVQKVLGYNDHPYLTAITQ